MTKSNFPIIDLHCHFEGSIDPQKSYEILHRIGYAPAQNQEEFFQHVTGYKPGREGFFNAVALLNMCLIDQASIIEVTADIVTRAAQQNVKILEMSFAPRTFKLRKPQEGDLRKFMEALLTGVETGVHNQDIAVGLTMLILPRHLRQESIERCGDIHDIIREYRQHISGVDICSLDPIGEEQFSETHLQKICETVRASGLHLSAHAGEFFSTQPVEKAIGLGVKRIGHGIRTINNQEVLERVKEHNITLEVCPLSNYLTGALEKDEKHPLRQLLKAGVRTTINTDDQGVQNSTWGDDYTFAVETIGLTDDEIKTCLKYSFEASFLEPGRKKSYRELFEKEHNVDI